MFTNKDRIFFSTLSLYKDIIEKNITKSLEYNIEFTEDIMMGKSYKVNIQNKKNKKKMVKDVFILGVYNTKDSLFKWSPIRQIIHDNLKNFWMDVFGTTATIDKIFTPTVNIEYEDHCYIPYLVNLIRPDFNVIRFETQDKSNIIYAMINIGYKNDFHSPLVAFLHYRKSTDEGKKLSRQIKLNSIKIDNNMYKYLNRALKNNSKKTKSSKKSSKK